MFAYYENVQLYYHVLWRVIIILFDNFMILIMTCYIMMILCYTHVGYNAIVIWYYYGTTRNIKLH